MSYETHLKDQKKKHNAEADADIAQYEKDNAALKEQINASLDAAAESQAGVYRQEIEQAPLDSRALYDQNAMREAIDRKKIQESLANMGMTDSGLSSSMQTALTVQKSRADNSVRAAEQQRIRAAESTIDQIFANKEQQKAQKGIEIDQDTAAYARTRRENANAMATETATALHNADVEAQNNALKVLQEQQNKRAAMAQSFINKGVKNSEAWAQAYYAYPDDSTEGVKYAYYKQLRENGYDSEYANAMSDAYTNAYGARGTEEQVNQAVVLALMATADEEVRKAGVDLQGGVVFGGGTREKYNPTADYAARIASANMAKLADKQLSDTGRMYATACMTGAAYAEILNDANAQQIGEALAQNFSGIYLEIALSYAGLE
ncbi:MAG: hypothetical protein IKL13_00535 [Clostridia bacterium]|nr:hypothetical protein [Clostridia bacterium]